jgi:hypothetical protein
MKAARTMSSLGPSGTERLPYWQPECRRAEARVSQAGRDDHLSSALRVTCRAHRKMRLERSALRLVENEVYEGAKHRNDAGNGIACSLVRCRQFG